MKAMPIRPALTAVILGASLLLVATGTLLAAGRGVIAMGRVEPVTMVLQNVSLEDLIANRRGICDGPFTHVIKNSAGPNNETSFLDAAAICGVKVIMFFPTTADHAKGLVYPNLVPARVDNVKNHPALWGYLSVKEPSWSKINATEIRQLYTAFKARDAIHPVMALFGDIPHFGDAANPYTAGMADVVMVDWYPVETANNGSSSSGTFYQPNGPTWFTKVRNAVNATTPNRPIWLMVQTHKYTSIATHKKQLPTEALLRRQVSEGLASLGARGIAFHTWSNTSYQMDQLRSPDLIPWMKTISTQVRNGTFN